MRPREILEKEELCIEEHAPFCMAECPAHFDGREMSLLIENGEWETAYERYQAAVLFPRAVSEGCLAPCEAKCRRADAGEAIAIHETEKAVVRVGEHHIQRNVPEIEIKKRVGIVGGGFAPLASAHQLTAKGYTVHLFVPEPEKLKENSDFSFLQEKFVILHDIGGIRPEWLDHEAKEYDALFFGALTEEEFCRRFPGAERRPYYFFEGERASIIEEIAAGKSMAITLDRFVKGVSVTAGRSGEGSYQTQLYTSVDGIKPAGKTPKKGAVYTKEEAMREAQRCIKCRCMECVKECGFLEKYEKYPRKYIREVFNNISTGKIAIRAGKSMISSCTLCGLCGNLCVNHIPMAQIYQSARQALVTLSAMPPRYHDFPLRDMLFSNSDEASFFRHGKGTDTSRYMFFPGCQLAAIRSRDIRPMYQYLISHLGPEVGLMLGCCGAPASWAGRKDLYEKVLSDFRTIWEEAGKPEIITACPTCNREFMEAIPEARVQTIWHYYAEKGLPETDGEGPQTPGRVIVHDPCTTRYRGEMHDEIRSILAQKGYEVKELDYSKDKTRCCGYGGLAGFIDRELAEGFAQKRVSELSEDCVTYCAVCRDVLANEEKPVFHILDILHGRNTREDGLAAKTGISEKKKAKTRLKRILLKEIWEEETLEMKKEYDNIKLIIEDEVKEKLEIRLILEENLKEVIFQAEGTGAKIVKPNTGRFFASARVGIVTYWVEYAPAPQGDAFIVYSAYSHRIQIMED